jgi:Skp family chaperone for outer membrane proteins
MNTIKTTLAALLIGAFTLPAFAQSPTATPGLDQRQANQEKRIEQGVKSGQLTKREAARLEKREGKLEADKQAAKADGKVTKAERRKLNREADRDSRAIYRQKHDAQRAPK